MAKLTGMPSFTKEARNAASMALAAKTLILAALAISFYAGSDFDNVPNLWNRWYTGQDDLSSWYIPFSNWDGQYYLLLSDWGYNYDNTPDSPRAFFPLYPLLIRTLSYVMPRLVAAALLSYLLTAGLCFFLFIAKLSIDGRIVFLFVQTRQTLWLSQVSLGYFDHAFVSHRIFCFGLLYGGTVSVPAIWIRLSFPGYQE